MLEKEGGATADNSGPALVLSAETNSALPITNAPKTQSERGPAPFHLLVGRCQCSEPRRRCKCVPRVLSVARATSVFVGIAGQAPWGWGNCVLEFINAPRAAEKYARELNERLRVAAWAEHDRRERSRGRL